MESMKQQILFALAAAMIMFAMPQITGAASAPAVSVEQQIKLLQDQIAYLRSLIGKLILSQSTLADSYALVNLNDGTVVAQKNDSQEYPIASVTKLMTATVAVENIDLDNTITLTPAMLSPEGYSPSLFVNDTVSGNDLLRAMLIQSANDAAQSLSYFIGNQKFVALMNQKAQELGMSHTAYYDAHGLNPNNHSTAADLAKLLSYIYKNHPEILAITKENDFWLPDETGKLLKFQNVNNFYQNPDFIGAKTGYIPQAKQTLASVVEVNGRPTALVLLHSSNRQKDALAMVDWIKRMVQ
jgi:D-alanyl-D-alanine carboxypeptidase